jgi:protein SCO1/2
MRSPHRLAALLASGLLAGCAAGGEPPTLPAFELTDQSGRTVRTEDLRGRPLVVSFVFTTCVEACPIVVAQLVRLQAHVRAAGLAERVRFVSITLDPMTDTPDVLRRYAAGYGADLATWHFLTGQPDAVGRLVAALGIGTAPGPRGLAHDVPLLFVDPAGRIVERRTDLELRPEVGVARLRKLLGS